MITPNKPFLMGCDTKSNEIILLCLSSIQRLITHKILNEAASGNIVSILWQLMDAQVKSLLCFYLTKVKFLEKLKKEGMSGVLNRAH